VFEKVAGGVLAAAGYRGAGARAGVKSREGALDVALIVSDVPARAAGVFTSNRIVAAPVELSRERIAGGRARVIVVNSGNANACTGQRGLADARAMSGAAARALGIAEEEVLVASTGIIGVPLPVEPIAEAIETAAHNLSDGSAAAEAVAEAILTTDTGPKTYALRFNLNGETVTLGGIAKGAGMISPHLATMLCFITTDAAVEARALQHALQAAVDVSFNQITVDGHESTNDTVLLLANGQAQNEELTETSELYERFVQALAKVCRQLAQMIVRDGEGATKFVEIHVRGARTEDDARKAARAVADSPLVKTALFGAQANWGRIISAVGYSRCELDPDLVEIRLAEELVFAEGAGTGFDVEALQADMQSADAIRIGIDLRLGEAEATLWTCDLTHRYVDINASYHS